MGHVSWEELEQRQAAARAQIGVGSLWPAENTPNAHEVLGHCIIEATDMVGVLHRPIGYQAPAFVSPLSLRTSQVPSCEDLEELDMQCRLAALKVATGSVWEHNKTHGTYKVLGRCVLQAQENFQTGILYHAVSRPHITFARSLSSWLETVDIAGKLTLRYEELV